MCASFLQKRSNELFQRLPGLAVSGELKDHEQSSPITFPFQTAEVIKKENDTPILCRMRYSLTPSWSKEEKPKFATYNARLKRFNSKTQTEEFIFEVPTWKESFGRRNCVVPINEFFESCREGQASGHMVSFFEQSQKELLAAGIWNDWLNKETGEEVSTFAILTSEPTDFIQKVGHDRSPVFLNDENAIQWLNGFQSGKEAYQFLQHSQMTPSLEYTKVRPLKAAKS
jgi:putative SOS response-associated peptidase YedK